MSNNSVSVTLFHATWCGHCVKFMPEWERMKKTQNIAKNIDFAAHESSEMNTLDVKKKTINGNKIGGYPTIKISLNGSEFEYEGERKTKNILSFIRDKIKTSPQKGGENPHETEHRDQ